MDGDIENEDKTCDLCNISYFNDEEFKEHAYSLMHHIKIEQKKKNSVHHCTLCFGTYGNIALYSQHLNEEKHRSAVQGEKRGKQAELDFTKPDINIETVSTLSGSQNQKRYGVTLDKDQGSSMNKSFVSSGSLHDNRSRKGTFQSKVWNKPPNFEFVPKSRSCTTLNTTVEYISDINSSHNDSFHRNRPEMSWNRGPHSSRGQNRGFHHRWDSGPNWANNSDVNNWGSFGNGAKQFYDDSFHRQSQDFTSDDYHNFHDHDFDSKIAQNNCLDFRSPQNSQYMDWDQQSTGSSPYSWRKGDNSVSSAISPRSSSNSVKGKKGKSKVSPQTTVKGPSKKSPKDKIQKAVGSAKKKKSPNSSRHFNSSQDGVSSSHKGNKGSKGKSRDRSASRVGASLSGGRYQTSKSPQGLTKRYTMPNEKSTSQDKGNALLTRAENLCKEVRKARKETQKRKDITDLNLRKLESKMLEHKIQGYSDLCQSQMKGFVSSDRLSELDKSLSELTSTKSDSTVDLSVSKDAGSKTKKITKKQNDAGSKTKKITKSKTKKAKVDEKSESEEKDQSFARNLNVEGVSKELNNNKKTPLIKEREQLPTENLPQLLRKSQAKTVTKPAVDTAKVNFVKQNAAPLTKNNLMKIINAPRSHKERMQLASLMKGSKPKPLRPKLNLQPQEPTRPTDVVDIDFGEQESDVIAYECLPDELRIKVEKLLNEGIDAFSDSEMCFSDIEGVDFALTAFDNCAVEAPLVELPDMNPNGKRRRSANRSSTNLSRVDSSPSIENKKLRMDEQDHSSVEVSLPPNNQRSIRDLDPGSSTDASSRASSIPNRSQSSSYPDWTRTNDLSVSSTRQASGSASTHSVASANKSPQSKSTSPKYSSGAVSHASHVSNGDKGQTRTPYSSSGNKSFIPPFTSTSQAGLQHGSVSPQHSSGSGKSSLSYSDADHGKEPRSPLTFSVKREPAWEEGYGLSPASNAPATYTSTPQSSSKSPKNFQTSSIFSSNFTLQGKASHAAQIALSTSRHSRTSSNGTDSSVVIMSPPRSRTAESNTPTVKPITLDDSSGKNNNIESSYLISSQKYSSSKQVDHQSPYSHSSHSRTSSGSSTLKSITPSLPLTPSYQPPVSTTVLLTSSSLSSSMSSVPSIQNPRSPVHSQSSSSSQKIMSPSSALSSASQALETANTALATINTSLSFTIPFQDINKLELEANSTSRGGQDPINRVLQITIKEEEIRGKLSTVNNHVDSLGSLMKKLQTEFDKFKSLQTQLETEGQNLRKERLSILQGAVAEKQVSDMVKEVTTGLRKPTYTNPVLTSTPKNPQCPVNHSQSQNVTLSETSSAQSSFSIPCVMPPPKAESSPVKVKAEPILETMIEVLPTVIVPQAPVIKLRPVPEPVQAMPVVAVQVKPVPVIETHSSVSAVCEAMSVKPEPVEMETDATQSQTQMEDMNLMPAIFPCAVIKQEGTVPMDSCTPVEMEYVGSLKTANEAQDLLKEIASNLKDTSFIIVEGGEFLKKTRDQALVSKSKDVGVQMVGNSGITSSDYDSSLSDIHVVELNPNKDPQILHNILKSPDAHSADNSYDRILKKDTFNEKERFKAMLLETIDTSMKLGVTPEEVDSSDTSPAKIAMAVKQKALKECSVVLERLDKSLTEMVYCTSTSGISSVRASPKKIKSEDAPILVPDSPTTRRKMKKTKKERNRSRANVADSSSETQTAESGFTTAKTSGITSKGTYDPDRDELRKSGVCFTASDVEALGSSANVSFDAGLDLAENDTSTLIGSQTTEFGPAEESELTVTSSSDVDSYRMKNSLKISSQTASLIRNKLLKSTMVEMKKVATNKLLQSTMVDMVATPGLFVGHTEPVFAMQIFENFLFSCSKDTTVRKFDLSTHQCINEFQCHTHPIHCLRVTRCGGKFRERLFTGATDSLLLEHDALTGEFLSRVIMADKVHCMHEQWNMLFLGLGNGQIICYDLLKSKAIEHFPCGDKPISCISSAQEGPRKILLIASFDSSISVRDAMNGLLLRIIDNHVKTPLSVLEKDNIMYSGASDRTIRMHYLDSGTPVHCINMKGPVTCLALCGKYLLASSYDGMIRCYNTKDSYKLKQVYYGAGKTLIMDMLIYKDLIYTANREGTIEAIPFDPSLKYLCKFRDCGLLFGLSADLRYHIFNDHLQEQIKNNRYHCNWHGCFEKLEVETNKKNLEDHISGHITEVEGTVGSESM